MEGRECFGLAACRVQEWRGQHIHALDIDASFGSKARLGTFGGECQRACAVLGGRTGTTVNSLGRRFLVVSGEGLTTGRDGLRAGLVEFPGNSIQQTDEGGLAHAAAEKRVGGQGTEGVVADFGVGR